MRNNFSKSRLILLSLALSLGLTAIASGQQAGKSLYQRLGGYDAIAAFADDFIGRLASDPQFTKFFGGFSTDSKKKLRQRLVDQLCQATGGPCIYTGRSMKESHAGLGITEKEWDAGAKHILASLDKLKVQHREKDEVMALVATLKKDIVEK
jgi:hemoglobin